MVMYIHNIAIIPRAISWRIYPELVVWIIHRSTSIETKSKGLYITHLSNGSIFFRHRINICSLYYNTAHF